MRLFRTAAWGVTCLLSVCVQLASASVSYTVTDLGTLGGPYSFGYGLNKFGEWQYYQLYYLVGGIWLFQLIVSPLWLRAYQFGPLEWVWRMLTYWRKPPMRRVKQQRFEPATV